MLSFTLIGLIWSEMNVWRQGLLAAQWQIIVLHNQTFFFLYWDGEKRCGTSNSNILFRFPPELGWVMIGDN